MKVTVVNKEHDYLCMTKTVNKSILRLKLIPRRVYQQVLVPRFTDWVCNVNSLTHKMFSFFKNLVSSVLPWGTESPAADLDEDERTILNNIKSMNFQDGILDTVPQQEFKFEQSEPVQYEVETFQCVHKTGKVTYLSEEYGLIDNVLYFDLKQVSPVLTLIKNDEVLYSAFKLKENEAERVYRIYALKDDPFECGNSPEVESIANGSPKIEEIAALSRVVTGRVTKRRGREVYIESADIWCNLDKIQTSYIPIEGDWVELQAIISIGAEADDLSGDILEVKSLKPLLRKSGHGRVTFWSESRGEGAIENSIYFTQIACTYGYIPNLGDNVAYSAVESDQERFRWRALEVCSGSETERDVINTRYICNPFIADDMSEPKNGISIKPVICHVDVELDEVKTVLLEVTNNGEKEQILVSANFLYSRKNSQLKLISPKEGSWTILPEQSITYQFECEGKLLGLSGEIFVFHFQDFVVTKKFEISVSGNQDMNRLLECKFGSVVNVFKEKNYDVEVKEADFTVYGPKPWHPPKFLSKEMRRVFNIPKKLWALTENGTHAPKKVKSLLKYAPYLKEQVKFASYADRFHTLLFLEELGLRINFKKFGMSKVILRRHGEYLVLDVPGLVEKRPSLIVGDKIVLMQPWKESYNINHIGYIHDISKEEVFVKFHKSFHEEYDESECDVSFVPQTSFFSKAHEAVNRAVNLLGEQWLFPSAVNEKPPQVDFQLPEANEEISESVANFFEQVPKKLKNKSAPAFCHVKNVESLYKSKKTLSWVNQNLNERQKLAVVNVLRGVGRPLPYIIFGPPGTGKTITLVETAIQLYRLMPESRILINTPSNSSADLISERLIDIAKFKPGELVRLVALYKVHEGSIPPKLVPYSTYYGEKDDGKKDFKERTPYNRIRSCSSKEVTGRHRITVSTCSAISILHYQGLPPGHFTHILVDEAGQTSEPEVLISVTFQDVQTSQVVLTGDPLQLGPVVSNSIAQKFGLGISLMQRLTTRFPYARDFDGFPETSGFDPRFITQLNVNYRTVPEILSLPSQMFYNSDLIPTVSQTDSEEAKIIEKFNFVDENRKTPAAIIFHGIIGQNYQENDSPSWFNPHEIWQVVLYLRKLYSIGLKKTDIGIIAPYSKQVHKIRNLLPKLDMSIPKIGSVEEFQGQERNVIILSSVRSSPKLVASDVTHSLGFVSVPQRLNVALTRARGLLIIVGNPILLSKDPYWSNVIKYCIKNKSYTGFDFNNELFSEGDDSDDKKTS